MAGIGQQRQAVGHESGDQLGEKIQSADDQRPFESLGLGMPLHGLFWRSIAQASTAIKHAILILAGSTAFSHYCAVSFDQFCGAPEKTSFPADSYILPCSQRSRQRRSRCPLFADLEWRRRCPG